jgi:hypothetical protein
MSEIRHAKVFTDDELEAAVKSFAETDGVAAVCQLLDEEARGERDACMSAGLTPDLRSYHCGRLSLAVEFREKVERLRFPAG